MNVHLDYDNTKRKGIITSDILQVIREYFSVENPAARFHRGPSFGYRPPDRLYAITPQGRFEPLLAWEILDYLKATCSHVPVEITTELQKIINPPPLGEAGIVKLSLKLRDYQEGSLIEAINKRCGVIVLPTSAGKTLVMASLIQTIRGVFDSSFRTLLVVPNIQLVTQSYKDFISYGLKKDEITRWTGDNVPNNSARIIIANTQILMSKIQDMELLKYVNLLIVDEAHGIKAGNKINKVLKQIPAKFRFGFTGTMPESKIDKWNVISQLGPVIYQKKSVDLREQKHITEVKAVGIKITYKNPPIFTKANINNPTEAYEEEITYLQTQPFRNSVIKDISSKMDKNCLILVDRIPHGEFLLDHLKDIKDKQVFFVRGSMEMEEREMIRQLMETNNNVICIAISKIFSTGINIRNLHYVFFASIGKAKTKIIQSIGRILRLHASKDMAIIFDIGDDLIYGNKHFDERQAIYKSEQIPFTLKQITEP